MNEESKRPSIEPGLEARIVALVLGEASDFECEELNRLIELRPELAAFKLQMQSVHGLLQDVGAGEFDAPAEDWKLPADKRNAVLAVIRGEATVQAVTQVVNQSAQQRVSAKRSLRQNLTPVAAFVCVVGLVGLMTLRSFFTQESASSEFLSEMASVEAPHNQEPSSAGSSVHYKFDAGAGVAKDGQSRSGLVPDPGKSSEVALTDIQNTLNAAVTLPSAEYQVDDIRYQTANPSFVLPGEASGRHKVSPLGTKDRVTSTIENGPPSTPLAADSPELIARNDGRWWYKGFTDADRESDGREASQPNALFDSIARVNPSPDDFDRTIAGLASPSVGNGNSGLSFPMVETNGGAVSDSAAAAIRLRTRVPDGGTVLLGGISIPSAAESGGESDDLSSTVTRELGELNVSGTTPAVVDEEQILRLTDVDSPEEESTRSLDFDINSYVLQSQASGSGQGQAQEQLQERSETEREFFKNRMALPDDAGRGVRERFGNESKWMDNSDLAATTEPAGEPVDRQSGDLFGSGGGAPGGGRGGGGGRGPGRSAGAAAAGSGGFGLNQPLQESIKEIPADAKRIAEGEMEGIANFEDSETWSRPEVPGGGGRGKTRAAVAVPVVDGFDSSPASAIKSPADELRSLNDLVRLGKAVDADPGREESRKKSDASLRAGDVKVNSEKAQGNRESYSMQIPAPVTGTAVGQPPVSYSDGVALYGETLPSKQKEQHVELQRKSGGLGLAGRVDRRFRQVAPILDDNSESIKRSRVRKTAPTAGLNETTVAEEAFSTFSLHVSDVSFKLSLAALTRGEWPEAATVRIEEFVNALDYGDPMPCKGEKVACRVEQSIHPFVQQRNLLRVSMKTAAAGRSSNTPLRLTFLLDNSGSMERIDRQQTVRRAFALLAQQLTPIDQVTLISFARQPRLLADKVSGSEAGQLVRLIDELPSEGGTNIEAALRLAFEKAREQQTPSAQNRIILLTDGAVNLGNANPQNLSQMVTTMRSAGIAFDAAGISADGLNDEVLEALTRKGDGRYYLLDSLEAADDGFARQIAGALRPSAKNVKVQVEFNPKRVGRYKLLGFEKHILKKEDFRNDKVDAAEMAAAEAGVAMYQFEAKPEGEGDVGSVSVRFRDLSTGQMIENRWPIPYEADAPRPDQAAPSLRIAASAAMLAAKLRGEPLGETVDLQALSHLMSGLPERDRDDNRVQQLQQMIEQARQLSEK